ncbi:ribbon-helix-helix domain-containing protein [Zobellia nedashkovskayae]|uniref:ribbon-helix-helix domain-containing protein n=1 Tax=Zobellia nedashkovskayae TaxID=2779510 RepID=UPI00188D3D4D|nr:type II toxin-antitoxin system ParD family antitoxin [Zobellia nedashkovskayae]
MNIDFTKEQHNYLEKLIASGEYENINDVLKDAISLHSEYRQKSIKNFQIEVERGWSGPGSKKSLNQIIASKKNN